MEVQGKNRMRHEETLAPSIQQPEQTGDDRNQGEDGPGQSSDDESLHFTGQVLRLRPSHGPLLSFDEKNLSEASERMVMAVAQRIG